MPLEIGFFEILTNQRCPLSIEAAYYIAEISYGSRGDMDDRGF